MSDSVQVGDAALHVVDLGGGGPICLMLHGGLGMDHTYFRPTFDRLGDRVRVVYYDMRANGRSTGGPVEALTMEQWADDAVAVADHLGADRFIAVGHSYGGFVAQELAARHPDRLLGLALLNTVPGGPGQEEPMEALQATPPPSEQLELMGSPVTSDADMASVMERLVPFYVHRIEPAVLAAQMESTVFRHDTMIRSGMVLSQWSVYDRLPAVTCPTLIVAGRHDTFCAPEHSLRIHAQVPHATLAVFEESGHFPWLEEADDFWAQLDRWLATVV